MSHAAFFQEALPYVDQVHAATGVLRSVLLAQCSAETGFGGYDWSVAHNPGNVGSFDGQPVNRFPTLQAGTNAWIQTMLLGYYASVRHAVGWRAQCVALGESPWASGHYNDGGGAGSLLIAIIQENNLTQYDAPVPAPPPPAPPAPVAPPVVTNYPGVSVVSHEMTLPSALDGNGNGYFSAPALGISSVNSIVSVSWITTIPATSGYAKLPTNWGIDANNQFVVTGGSPNGRYGCIIWTTD